MRRPVPMLAAFVNILGSSAAAQLLLLASTPLLMRVHGQAEFGVFGVATAAALAASVLISLRLDHSLHLSDEPSRLLGSCLQITAIGSLVLAVPALVVAVAGGDVTALFTLLFAAGQATWTTTLFFLNLRGRFRAIAVQNLVPPVVFVAGALWGERVAVGNALLFWQAVAYAASAASGLWLVRDECRFEPLRALGGVLRRHRDDIRYLVPSRLLALLASNVAVLGSAWLYGPELAGLVVVANRVARAPVRVLGNGMSNVLRASIVQPGALHPTFTRISVVAGAAALIGVACVAALPPTAYPRLFGAEWAGLGPVLLITTVASGFQLLATSVESLLATYDKRASFHVNLALFVAGIGAILAAAALGSGLRAYLWIGCLLGSLVHATGFALSLGLVNRLREPRVRPS